MKGVRERIDSLRVLMRNRNLSWFLDTGTDEHMSEYVASHWRTREFLTGFTGSAGEVLIGLERAFLWTDSRYFLQARSELEGSGVVLMRKESEDPSIEEWLKANSPKGAVVGVCGSTICEREAEEKRKKLEECGLSLSVVDDLVGEIWPDRPPLPFSMVRTMPVSICGESSHDKLARIRRILCEKGCECTFISAIDDIAWITNLRGGDAPCNPVFLSHLFIDQDRAVLFTDPGRFSDETRVIVEKDFVIRPYEEAKSMADRLTSGRRIYLDPERTSWSISASIHADRKSGRNIPLDLKARKNPVELEGMRKSHLMDAIAFANAFSQVDFSKTDSTYTEMSISAIFEEERKKLPGYQGPSFSPISAFASHGAIVHYSASEESNEPISHSGLVVLDTGSQFDYGMTDLTRTLLFGEASEEEKRDYTLVLKGHLALSDAAFIAGTRGCQLDVLAKQFMWKEGMSFFHGTGHGVGFNLNVHEGPQRISGALVDVPLETGMVVSDEPGIYKEGRHGIRIENLLAVKDWMTGEFGHFLSFEVLTLVPYERRLIDVSMLTDDEIRRIDSYHRRVYEEVSPYLDEKASRWLERCTLPLENVRI